METPHIGRCQECRSTKIRHVLDYKHIILGKYTESLWVCDNCYRRFKRKYMFPQKLYKEKSNLD